MYGQALSKFSSLPLPLPQPFPLTSRTQSTILPSLLSSSHRFPLTQFPSSTSRIPHLASLQAVHRDSKDRRRAPSSFEEEVEILPLPLALIAEIIDTSASSVDRALHHSPWKPLSNLPRPMSESPSLSHTPTHPWATLLDSPPPILLLLRSKVVPNASRVFRTRSMAFFSSSGKRACFHSDDTS